MSGQKTTEERTEAPTPKRIKDLRKKNTVLRSPEFSQAIALITLVAAAPLLLTRLLTSTGEVLVLGLSEAGSLDVPGALDYAWSSMRSVLLAVAPPVGLVLAAVALTGAALTKGRPNLWAVAPRVELLKPKTGIKRIFGVTGLLEAAKGLAKLTAVAIVCATVLPAAYATFLEGPPSLGDFLRQLAGFAEPLLWRIAAVGLLIGVIDLLISRKRFKKQTLMTKTEVRRESKNTEGDPMLRQARRQRAAQLSRNRMIADVTTATVVVTNPTHIAIALRYSADDPAPIIIARGAGVLAGKIKSKAWAAGIPVQENKPLARSLYRACRVGDVIPVELYSAVAAVLASVMKGKRRAN